MSLIVPIYKFEKSEFEEEEWVERFGDHQASRAAATFTPPSSVWTPQSAQCGLGLL